MTMNVGEVRLLERREVHTKPSEMETILLFYISSVLAGTSSLGIVIRLVYSHSSHLRCLVVHCEHGCFLHVL